MHCFSSERKLPFGNTRWFKKLTVITIVGCGEPSSVMKRASCGLEICGPSYAVKVPVVLTGWFCPMVRQLVGLMPLLYGWSGRPALCAPTVAYITLVVIACVHLII